MTENSQFKPKSGQIDYTDQAEAPVMNSIVKFGDKILLLKRSKKLKFYPDCWSGVSGFLDDSKSVEEKVKEELKEEIGIGGNDILSIKPGEMFERIDPDYNKKWLVHPVLVELKTDKIVLNWEAEDYHWVELNELKNFELIPGFDLLLEKLLT